MLSAWIGILVAFHVDAGSFCNHVSVDNDDDNDDDDDSVGPVNGCSRYR